MATIRLTMCVVDVLAVHRLMKNVVGIIRGDDIIIRGKGIDVIVHRAGVTTNGGGMIEPKVVVQLGVTMMAAAEKTAEKAKIDSERTTTKTVIIGTVRNEGIERSIIDEKEMIDTKANESAGDTVGVGVVASY